MLKIDTKWTHSGAFEITVTQPSGLGHSPLYGVVRLQPDVIPAYARATLDALGHELRGLSMQMECRAKNRPYLGARVLCGGAEHVVRGIREQAGEEPVVEIESDSGQTGAVMPWSACEWAA